VVINIATKSIAGVRVMDDPRTSMIAYSSIGFLDRVIEHGGLDVGQTEPVDWAAWRKGRKPAA
jgi:hypothetical protein